ncbi:uncharacterized protein K02A2.6-like [Macrosteles quadrilineatus]|uniref:uncharacterized protein K02A2.6-like n=1 Tax=Macrosteles quadrilineatus TaxID=74068 RepID=UPI0023E1C38B|nr:uncharacterized protein K02A2.6-like [Macrosteles quadrilineatus]
MPYALQEKVEKELERLETLSIITRVESSDWGTPIVPVVKPNGSVRICADYKVTLNKVIKDEHYPIPRIDDIMPKMHCGKIFCTLDISNAYLHMEMDEDSATMQTISTHKGLFKVNRLMFGVKVAPLLWQRFMDKTLHNLEGVQCFFDDVIVQGSNREQLLRRLEQVFERLKLNDLRLNREKCKFFQNKIEYLGHVIDSKGLHKSDAKIQSILKCKRPENQRPYQQSRIFNYAHFLSGFDYDIEYRQTAHHCNADYLSRFPIEVVQEHSVDDLSKYYINQLETLNINSTVVAKETLNDAVLGPVLQALKSGQSVEQYGFHDNELSIQDDCVLKGWRVMIPQSLRPHVLRELHVAHLGGIKMKALARSF